MELLTQALSRLRAVAILLLLAGCLHTDPAGVMVPAAGIEEALDAANLPAEQLLLVLAEGKDTSRSTLYYLERLKGHWRLLRGPIPAVIGRNGFAAPGEKREGDGATPTGLFPLEFVFGYAPAIASAMPYRQATAEDIWVDDENCPDYNCWVKRGTTTASSYEKMRLSNNRYRHGIVIGYNRSPVLRGLGSAIFVHVLLGEEEGTSGCIALPEAELVGIIGRLDPARKPMILMGDRKDLAALPGLGLLATTASGTSQEPTTEDTEVSRRTQRKIPGENL